ncbi:MAG: hypothetical protein JWR07_2 [Nevskia sp.]|nr:hypothetical protein [Nevskia sp.]
MKRCVIALSLVLSSCASEWQVLDGHRNEGTIDMSYLPRLFKGAPDEQQAIALATEKCNGWGYGAATELNIPIKFRNWGNSGHDRVIQKYQCTITQGAPPLSNSGKD